MEESEAESASREAVIRAAGGVIARQGVDGLEVLVVHRPQYDDWSLPKGKCLAEETDEECALREVAEETGLLCELGDELPATVYRDAKGRMKRARYWSMTPRGGELAFEYEVDAGRWLAVAEAKALLTYERDVAVVDALAKVCG